MLTCDTYLTPESLKEALDALAGAGDDVRLLAGATDTFPWARQGRAGDVTGDRHVATLIDISRVPELAGYAIAEGRVRLGANVVFQDFLEDQALMRHLPNMPYCAVWFADDQIRRQATLAGNLANASPAADGTPALLVLNGEMELARPGGDAPVTRTVPVQDFITGPGKTVLHADEIVVAISCDSLAGYGGSFEKVGQRRSLVISVACASCCVKPSEDGRHFEDIRLALGGVGPLPIRLDDVEAALIGQPITMDNIREASALSALRVASRSRRDYREEVVRGFTERAVIDALADCGAMPDTVLEEVVHG